MVLLLQDVDDARFFVLSQDSSKGRPSYSLHPWPAGDVAGIEPGGVTAVSDAVVNAITHGVPIPRDGSLFGWTYEEAVTAVIAVYTMSALASPQPIWATMPLAGTPEAEWPPFTDERFFGDWFWEHYRAGRVVLLDDLVAGTPGTVYWVDTRTILGSDSCAVARDIRNPKGRTLRRGRYVYYKALRAGKLVPPLAALLADSSKIDLAPRFR
jgi:hypothetical protein